MRLRFHAHMETIISRAESTTELLAGWSLAKLFQETTQK